MRDCSLGCVAKYIYTASDAGVQLGDIKYRDKSCNRCHILRYRSHIDRYCWRARSRGWICAAERHSGLLIYWQSMTMKKKKKTTAHCRHLGCIKYR